MKLAFLPHRGYPVLLILFYFCSFSLASNLLPLTPPNAHYKPMSVAPLPPIPRGQSPIVPILWIVVLVLVLLP